MSGYKRLRCVNLILAQMKERRHDRFKSKKEKMDDLIEDILDATAIVKERVKKINTRRWILIVIAICLCPVFYLMMAFSMVKLLISISGVGYIIKITDRK